MQFGSIPGRGSAEAIFILRQLQEKYLHKKKNTYFAFADLKVFDHVPLFVGGQCRNLEYMNGLFRLLKVVSATFLLVHIFD